MTDGVPMTAIPQLKMIWPASRIDERPCLPLDRGFELRLGEQADEAAFCELMKLCGWEFDQPRMEYCYSRLLPRGWFLVTDLASGKVVASAMSLHNYTGRSTFSGTLGWVGCAPEQRGRKLGSFVSAAVISRLLDAGYTDIELYTEHFREPAIVSYFRLGFCPYLYNDAVTEVWREVCARTGHPFTPDRWPTGDNAYPLI